MQTGSAVAARVVRWSNWSGSGVEHLVFKPGAHSITVDSVVVSGVDSAVESAPGGVVVSGADRAAARGADDGVSRPDRPFAACYRVVCDLGWRVVRVEVQVIGDERRLRLGSDDRGHW